MADRSWWVAAAVAVAVVAVVAVVGVAVVGVSPTGSAGDGAAAAGGGSSSEPGTAPPSARPSQAPTSAPASAPSSAASSPGPAEPSVVAPRVQTPRPDVPLAVPITSYEVLAPDRLQLRYTTGVPQCYGTLDRAHLQETGSRVVVTLLMGPAPTPPAGTPCPEIALVEDTVVQLSEPLGDRTVVDGVSGRAVRRGHERR